MKGKRKGLLEGLFILDLADEQGSFCSKLLADLGATVVKVENPEGDTSRATTSFLFHNANKLGVALSLNDREGRRSFRRLIHEADVFVETFRPDYLKSLDLDYRRLRGMNPRLIHISITGFGLSGPKCAYHACDTVLAAFGGQMHASGIPSGKPLKLFGPQSYYAASLFGANAVLLNLKRRKLTGQGCHIDLSVQEAVASTLEPVWIDYFHGGIKTVRQREDYQRESFSVLRCKDGFVQIPILRNWETLFELMASEGKSGVLSENKWQDRVYRETHFSQIIHEVEEWTKTHTKRKLFELGQAMGFPWAPVQSPEEALKSPQLKARRFFVRAAPVATSRQFSISDLPYRFSAVAPSPNAGTLVRGTHEPDSKNPEPRRREASKNV